jgi:sugar lactone lactonase YvrE
MREETRGGFLLKLAGAAAILLVSAVQLGAQASYPAPNAGDNPYKTGTIFGSFPDGRKWGSTAGVGIDSKGHIWAIDRCGGNSCANSDLPAVLEFDSSGKMLASFGKGMFLMPHSLTVDAQDHIYVNDTGKKDGKGAQVTVFDTTGKVIMTLGTPGGTGSGPDTFTEPTSVAVAKNGDIFVADAHSPDCPKSRIVKFSKDGKFITDFARFGTGPGQTNCPHSLAFDSAGRLYVGDRSNNRVDIFTQDGKFVTSWTQFGRPSGVYIRNDVLYVADSESTDQHSHSAAGDDYGYNPGVHRGLRWGSVKDGKVVGYIADPAPSGGSSAAEGVAAAPDGTLYGAEVGPKDVKQYLKN